MSPSITRELNHTIHGDVRERIELRIVIIRSASILERRRIENIRLRNIRRRMENIIFQDRFHEGLKDIWTGVKRAGLA